jgi:hypothetical protein
MPLREYVCKEHGRFTELINGDYPKTFPCPQCNKQSSFVFSVPTFRFDFRYGWDPGVGQVFDSARQRDNYLAEHGLEKNPDGAYGKEGADIRRTA